MDWTGGLIKRQKAKDKRQKAKGKRQKAKKFRRCKIITNLNSRELLPIADSRLPIHENKKEATSMQVASFLLLNHYSINEFIRAVEDP
jgi:hypothetical protein